MSTQRRFQIDLTDEELNSIDRLGSLAGIRTKKDVVLNAITIFRWAAKEALMGRSICSIDETNQTVRQLELPALSVISDKRLEHPTAEQIQQQLSGPKVVRTEFVPPNKGATDAIATVLESEEGGRAVVASLGNGTEKR